MTLVQDNSVQAINTALLSVKRDISVLTATKSTCESSGNPSSGSTDETTAGLEPGKTYNINISGNAATATRAKNATTAETATTANKVANALTVNGKTYDGSSAVDAGVQTVANGGTGVTTQADINKAFVGALEEGASDVTDGTEFVSSYASDNGFADTNAVNTPYRRKFIKVWNYIKGKISSVLGLSTDGLSLKGNITTLDNKYIRAICASNDYVQIMGSGTGDSGSGEISTGDNGDEPLYARQRDTSNNVTHEVTLLDASGNQKFNTVTANGFIGNLSGKADTAGTADKVASEGDSGMWIQGRAKAICKTTSAAGGGGWKTLASIKTASGSIEIGNLSGEDFIRVVYSSDADVNAGNNSVNNLLYIRRGNIESPHEVIANSAKASSKMVIPIGAPSQLEDGCIWIER